MHVFLLRPGTALKVCVHYQENLTFGVSQGRTECDGAVMNILFSNFLPFFFPHFHVIIFYLAKRETSGPSVSVTLTHTSTF